MHLPRRRSGVRLGDERSAVVWSCGVVAGSGELPGSSSVSDGHACVLRALAVRLINNDLYRVMVVLRLSVLVVAA